MSSERSERSRRTRFAKLGATRLPGRRASRVRGDSHLDRPSVRVIVTDHSCHPEPMLVTLSLSKGGAIDLRSQSRYDCDPRVQAKARLAARARH
jgi:hypothetical protein